jgi:hypothetical protein
VVTTESSGAKIRARLEGCDRHGGKRGLDWDKGVSGDWKPEDQSRVYASNQFPFLFIIDLTTSSIVAVHGLNGDPFKTWTEDGVIWFSDLLPKQLPNYDLRVSTFGYNSKVIFSGTTLGVRDFAMQLLSSLHLMRKAVRHPGQICVKLRRWLVL